MFYASCQRLGAFGRKQDMEKHLLNWAFCIRRDFRQDTILRWCVCVWILRKSRRGILNTFVHQLHLFWREDFRISNALVTVIVNSAWSFWILKYWVWEIVQRTKELQTFSIDVTYSYVLENATRHSFSVNFLRTHNLKKGKLRINIFVQKTRMKSQAQIYFEINSRLQWSSVQTFKTNTAVQKMQFWRTID